MKLTKENLPLLTKMLEEMLDDDVRIHFDFQKRQTLVEAESLEGAKYFAAGKSFRLIIGTNDMLKEIKIVSELY